MSTALCRELREKRCRPCEGGVPPLEPQEIERLSKALPEWSLAPDGKSIHRKWRVKDFLAAMDFFQQIAHVAEADDHHPDLHLTGYRNVMVELSTHAIGGLSENDFILAAKIDALPVELKAPAS